MEFFAGANTVHGFKSIFNECFKDINRIFILKGSSGCGKSTLMRRVAAAAKKRNIEYDLIRCSADVDSLDGIIINEQGVAIADGTAPHLLDVKYPCVRESIINLGQFWNEKALLPHRDEIISLTDKKSFHYKNAYSCLSAYGSVCDLKKQIISSALNRERLNEAALSLADKIITGIGQRKTIFSTAFTFDGIKTLHSIKKVKRLYKVNGLAGDEFIKSLCEIAHERGCGHTVSLSCTDERVADSVYFHESGVLVTTLSSPPCAELEEEIAISCNKFCSQSHISEFRARLRGADKLLSALAVEARAELALARSTHDEIEKIYIPAMDFSAMDEYTLAFINKLFCE